MLYLPKITRVFDFVDDNTKRMMQFEAILSYKAWQYDHI